MKEFKEDQIIYEDNHLIAVNKLSGQLVQGDKTGDASLLEMIRAFLKVKYEKPGNVFLGCIHRLDRPVTGVCIFAKTSKALSRMNTMFADRSISKQYFAAVQTKPYSIDGVLTDYLIKDPSKNKSFISAAKMQGAKKAELTYKLIHSSAAFHVLEIELGTGRPHQIRVQLANIKCPIIGDLKYGYPKANKDGSICLHCVRLAFTHPVSKLETVIKAELPGIPEWNNFKG